MWVGPERCKLAVVAANLSDEHAPFGGSAGIMFKREITNAGIGVDKVGFTWTSDDVVGELSAHGVEYAVLAGQDALRVFRDDLNVRECHGRAMLLEAGALDGPLGFPVFHPEAFARNGHWRSLLVEELGLLKRIATDRSNWTSLTPDTCVHCRGEFSRVDDHGVVYCETHWGRPPRERWLSPKEIALLLAGTLERPSN